MAVKIQQALKDAAAFKRYSQDRLRLGQTKISLEADGEITYSAPQRKPGASSVFKPLPEMMMNSLADVVAHSQLKTQIVAEVESEKEATVEKQASSSEDLYSEASGDGYELPQIDPDNMKIATDD